jgi:hypothetical protein
MMHEGVELLDFLRTYAREVTLTAFDSATTNHFHELVQGVERGFVRP